MFRNTHRQDDSSEDKLQIHIKPFSRDILTLRMIMGTSVENKHIG